MTFRLGLTVINIEVSRGVNPHPGKLGPDHFGQSTLRAWWCWPVAVLVLTDRER